MRIGPTVVDLSGADAQCAAEVANSIEHFHRDFPVAGRLLAEVRLVDFHDPREAEYCGAQTGRVDDRPMPPFFPVNDLTSYHIKLNRNYYGRGRRAYFEESYGDAWRKGFNTTSEPHYVFDHELGHILDCNGARLNKGVPLSFQMIQEPDAFGVSGYAMEGPHECFAEAFSSWWNGRPVGNANIQRAIRTITSCARGLERAA